MAESIEELTIHYEEGELVLRKQIGKRAVLSKGSWATIMYLYQDLDFGRPRNTASRRFSIRRYQKREGSFIQRSKFEISSANPCELFAQRVQDYFRRGLNLGFVLIHQTICNGQDR